MVDKLFAGYEKRVLRKEKKQKEMAIDNVLVNQGGDPPIFHNHIHVNFIILLQIISSFKNIIKEWIAL